MLDTRQIDRSSNWSGAQATPRILPPITEISDSVMIGDAMRNSRIIIHHFSISVHVTAMSILVCSSTVLIAFKTTSTKSVRVGFSATVKLPHCGAIRRGIIRTITAFLDISFYPLGIVDTCPRVASRPRAGIDFPRGIKAICLKTRLLSYKYTPYFSGGKYQPVFAPRPRTKNQPIFSLTNFGMFP